MFVVCWFGFAVFCLLVFIETEVAGFAPGTYVLDQYIRYGLLVTVVMS